MVSRKGEKSTASIHARLNTGGVLTLTIEGRLDSATTGGIWREADAALGQRSWPRMVVEASGITYCDGCGVGLLVDLYRRQQRAGGELEIRGLQSEFRHLLDLFDPGAFSEKREERPEPASLPEQIGQGAVRIWDDIRTLIAFVGELCAALLHALLDPRRVRWKDAFLVAETAGVNAIPIVALISFLVGLIMAFQGAIAMRQFGAEIFIADLIAITMVRELGPLLTAVLVAGRSGSAFAAELGTMRVTEEIDALTTMGLDPVRFLVTTRVFAALVMTPLLAVFADVIGVMGGSVVSLSLGYPLVTYVNRATASVNAVDFAGGLFKALIFGILIAAIGCLRGLQTGAGPSAVGESATRAVVSGIILIVIMDGVFGVLFYSLGI